MSDHISIRPFNKPFLVIAHRGASYDTPENTMSAFKLAHQMGAEMIELDVQLSKDGVPVVFHDSTLDKKSSGSGIVSSYTVRDLKQLDVGSWFSSRFKGEKIPLLEEVLEWAKNKILLNIEIKPEAFEEKPGRGIEEKVIELAESYNMKNSVLISSFHYIALKRLKEIAPDLTTGLLYYKKTSNGLSPSELLKLYRADFFHCSRREIKKSWVEELRQNNHPFLIYTVNRPRQMRKFIRMGAFGIFSDKPDLLKEIKEKTE